MPSFAHGRVWRGRKRGARTQTECGVANIMTAPPPLATDDESPRATPSHRRKHWTIPPTVLAPRDARRPPAAREFRTMPARAERAEWVARELGGADKYTDKFVGAARLEVLLCGARTWRCGVLLWASCCGGAQRRGLARAAVARR